MDTAVTSDPFICAGPFVHSISLNKLEFVENGIIVVSEGKIAFVQPSPDHLGSIQKRFQVPDANVHKLGEGQFLVPGLIDTHIHGSQYPNLGLGYELTLLDWLKTYTFPLEKKFSNPTFAEKVYNAVVKRGLANGTTTACYFATIDREGSNILANCVKNLGQRAFVGKVNMNKNTPPGYGETFKESIMSTRAFIDDVNSLKSPLVKPVITPRFALSCDMELLKALGELAAEKNLLIQTHVAENLDEVRLVKEEFPDCRNYVDVYDKAGLISCKTVLAHGIYLSALELDVIKEKQATISHCPNSNLLLNSGICPVRRYLDAGVKLSLGSDCSGGNTCSVLNCIRQAIFLSIASSMKGLSAQLTLDEVFYLATLGGAEALCLGNDTGNFQTGKDFDAILVDLKNNQAVDLLENYNLRQLFEKFIHLGDDRVMKKVFVAGKVVKQS